MSVVITRPNGKAYRPRKIVAVPLGNEDESNAVVVFGTHDIPTAEAHAEAALAEYLRDMGGYWTPGYTLALGEERLVWWRQVPDGTGDADQMLVRFVEDPVRGRAGVRFPYVEVEAAEPPREEGIMPPPLDGLDEPIGPDCREGKHIACDGRALRAIDDEIVDCACCARGHEERAHG